MQRAFITGGSGFIGSRLIGELTARGVETVALARSDAAARRVQAAGAGTVVRADLSDETVLESAARGADTVFHLAAHMFGAPGGRHLFQEVNVTGTRRLIAAAQRAGVTAFVLASTEQVLLGGPAPLRMVNEEYPYPRRHLGPYAATKAAAECAVLDVDPQVMRGVAVRPRLAWGAGDTSGLGQLVAAIRAGRFAWLGNGRFLTSTCHVANVVEGLVAAAEHGRAGRAYFVTDGSPVQFRDFFTRLLATQGVTAPQREIPRRLALSLGGALDLLTGAGILPRAPLSRAAAVLLSTEMTFDDTRARHELGYTGAVTLEAGLAELSGAGARP